MTLEAKDASAAHVEKLENGGVDAVVTADPRAAAFEAHERNLTAKQALTDNKKALAWCTYMFFLCIVWGFDGLAGSIVVSIPNFRKDFGTPFEGDYVVNAGWQVAWTAATLVGLIFGGLITGLAVNRFGRQPCILASLLIYLAGIFLQFFATTNAMFLGSKLLNGLPMGAFTTVAPPYASEVAPMAIRGAITSGMNFAIVLGQFLGYVVMRQAGFYEGAMTYKVLFATQWGFVAVGLAFLLWFPESPYWLISHGRHEKARANIIRLYGAGADVDGRMADIHESLARMNSDNETQGTILECFSKKQWRRTLAAASSFFIQTASGNAWVVGYMSYFMQLGGMNAATAQDFTVGFTGLMVVGNICGWFLVEWLGRRGTYLQGTVILAVTLWIIGIMASVNVNGALWAQVAFMGVWSVVYQATLGSAAWPIVAENATSRLRGPTQAVTTAVNGLSSCIWTFALPYAINPDEGNMGGKIGFVFAAVMTLSIVFVYFNIPETKGRSYVEIDELWERGVPPRKFKETQIITVGEGH